ncbi:MAG: hypothetical protein MZV70_07710 [Desulfobacterales bacterium]|nr:hypothetical protein [Desulfobacterales bacterium]
MMFFAAGVVEVAENAVATAKRLADLIQRDRDLVRGVGRGAPTVLQVHEALQREPVTTIPRLVARTRLSVPGATAALERLVALDLVREVNRAPTQPGLQLRVGTSASLSEVDGAAERGELIMRTVSVAARASARYWVGHLAWALLQDSRAQGTCAGSMRARLVGRLPRSSRQPVEVGESGDLRQGRCGGGARAIAGGCSCRNVRRSRTRLSAGELGADL